jgi:hypothetical protein
MVKVTVFGVSGRPGRPLVGQAFAAGHETGKVLLAVG